MALEVSITAATVWPTFEQARDAAAMFVHGSPSWRVAPGPDGIGFVVELRAGQGGYLHTSEADILARAVDGIAAILARALPRADLVSNANAFHAQAIASKDVGRQANFAMLAMLYRLAADNSGGGG